MILHPSPGSSDLVRAAATAALVLHIGGGLVGLASGVVALAARKGGPLHRAAGNVFFIAMLTMASVAAIVAPFMPTVFTRSNTVGGLFTVYLVATAWVTVRRPAGTVGRFEAGAILVALAAAAGGVWFVWLGAYPPAVMAALAILAAALDLRVILRGGLSGAARTARHVWRMCVALFIATGSFFIGQPQIFPAVLRGSPLLILLGVAPLGALAFWMIRIRLPARLRPAVVH
jgi:uncharacterized membrane protein